MLVKKEAEAFNRDMEEYERQLEQIEILLDDPMLKELIKKAKFVNEYLEEFPMSEEEAKQSINDLNNDWAASGLNSEDMRVSGSAWAYGVPNSLIYDLSLERSAYTQFINQETKPSGFALLASTHLDEEGIHTTQEIFLNSKALIDDPIGNGKKSWVDFIISLNNDTFIQYEGRTPKRAEYWLDLNYPDEKADILQAIVETDDEAEALLALRTFNVPIKNLDKTAVKELKQNLEIFVKDILNLGPHVPYCFQTCGTIKVQARNEKGNLKYVKMEALTPDQAFISVGKEGVLFEKTSDGEALEPVLFGAIIAANRKDLILCKIPFKEFDDFVSTWTVVEEYNKELRRKNKQ